MFKKMSVIIVSVVVCFSLLTLASLTSYVQAAENSSEKITGKVKDVDLDEQSVIVGASGKDSVIYVEKSTQIKQGTENKSLADIKVGIVVEINFKKTGDDLIAQSISII